MDLGKVMVKNIVALGALHAATDIFRKRHSYGDPSGAEDKCAMIPLNEEAFEWGIRAFKANTIFPARAYCRIYVIQIKGRRDDLRPFF